MSTSFGPMMGNAADKEFSIPTFTGNEDDECPVERFIVIVENTALASKWTDQETAANAAKAMSGKSSLWLENLRREEPEVANDWKSLKIRLINRFASFQTTEVKSEIKIKTFSGEEDDNYTIDQFISSVDRQAKNSNWNVKETAIKAQEALVGKAEIWFVNLTNDMPTAKHDWNHLKAKLQIRFGNIKSIAERVKGLNGLNQKGKESSEDFYDRISAQLYSLEQEILDTAESENERRAMIRMHHLFTSLLFVSGLEPEVKTLFLKEKIATQKVRVPTVDEIRSTAKTIDDAIKKKRKETSPGAAPSPEQNQNAKSASKSNEPKVDSKVAEAKVAEAKGSSASSKKDEKKGNQKKKERNGPKRPDGNYNGPPPSLFSVMPRDQPHFGPDSMRQKTPTNFPNEGFQGEGFRGEGFRGEGFRGEGFRGERGRGQGFRGQRGGGYPRGGLSANIQVRVEPQSLQGFQGGQRGYQDGPRPFQDQRGYPDGPRGFQDRGFSGPQGPFPQPSGPQGQFGGYGPPPPYEGNY